MENIRFSAVITQCHVIFQKSYEYADLIVKLYFF